jgi:hypothetical protein
MKNKLSKEAYTELINSVIDKVNEEMTPSIEKSLVIGLVEESIHLRYKETKDLKDFTEETNKRSSEDINIKENKEKQVDYMELSEDEQTLIRNGNIYQFNPEGTCKKCPFYEENCDDTHPELKCIPEERKDGLKGNWVYLGDDIDIMKKVEPIKKGLKTDVDVVLSTIKEQVSLWANSNDIKSPSHLSDISEVVFELKFNGILTNDEGRSLENKLIDLYYFVLEIK